MKSYQITIAILICVFFANGVVAQPSEYVPVGPYETENLEKGLYKLLPGYVRGIYPKAAYLTAGISAENLPLKYTEKIENWLKLVLKTELKPEQFIKTEWVGIRKLHWDMNYIVNRFSSNAKKGSIYENALVDFQANDRSITLTVTSSSLFFQDANDVSDTQIRSSVTKILNIPEDKINKISIEKHLRTVAGIDVCYGIMRCEWNEREGNDSEREWWSYIPFWYVKGKMFVEVSTIDWKKPDRPAIAKDSWSF